MCQTRLTRCLQLVNLLASRIGYSSHDLAREFEVSKRTIYRDLSLLTAAGVPVCYDARRRGYVLQNPSGICTAKIPSDELTVLLLVAHIFSLSCDADIGRSLRQAISKLLNQTPASFHEEIAGLLSLVRGKPSPTLWPQGARLIVDEILAAIRLKRQIRIAYRPPNGSPPSFRTKITPCQLTVNQGRWYLVG
jgi:predicted DNA-binding transcriptional regulator YafY